MRSLPPKARLFVAMIYLLGIIAAVAVTVFPGPYVKAEPWELGLFVILSALGGSKKVRLMRYKSVADVGSMSLGFVLTFTAMLRLGPAAAVLVGVSSNLFGGLFPKRQRPYQILFNVALAIITNYLSSLLFVRINGGTLEMKHFQTFQAVTAASLAFFLLNTAGVATVIALCKGEKVIRFWKQTFLWTAPSYFAGACVSTLAIVTFGSHVGAVMLFAAPVAYLTYQSYAIYTARAEEKQQHIEALHEAQEYLEQRVQERTAELAQANEGLQNQILERERAEVALKDSEEKFRSFVETTDEWIWSMDREGRMTYNNPAIETILGYSPEELLGQESLLLIHEEDRRLIETVMPVLSAQKHGWTNLVNRWRHKNGSYRYLESTAVPILDACGELVGYRGTDRDITERKQAEEELLSAKEAAEAASVAKSQFLANMSHELRTPMNAIIGFSEVLHDQSFGELNPRQSKYVTNILTSGKHLLQLINDILDLSKIEAGHMELELSQFSVVSAIEDVRNIVKTLAARKQIRLEAHLDPALPALVAEEGKFKQVLYNLLSNAIKFTPESGKVVVEAAVVAQWVQVCVRDNGVGLAPEDQGRIWGEFEQVDSSYSRTQQGTGLGLALTKKFVELHGGRIWVESDGEGKGSAFTFTIPLDILTHESAEMQDFSTGEAGDGQPLVLVVEDDRSASELLTQYLSEAGFAVAHASSGEQAVDMARLVRPQVITLDILLPGQNGWEALARLKSLPETRDIPVLIISVTQDRSMALRLGAADCFVKPVDKERLVNKTRALTSAARESLSLAA